MPYYVAFDTAHKPRGRIDENLTELRDFLNSNGFECYNYLEAPITQSSLKPYDILVFVCPDFSKISSLEITEIVNWVREDGGGLLLLSHAGGDKGRNSNLSELSQNFGISFENDQVLDSTYNLGMENMPIITSFIPPHPITNGISSLCFRSGCSLMVLGNAISIASSNETSEPFSSPLICVSEADKGRVCAIGSYEMFRDKVGGGFSSDEHPSLGYNIFNWLISEYRTELRASGAVPEIAPQPKSSISSIDESLTDTGARRNVSIDFSMKISRKSELFELLKIFQNQINMIKNTIDKLINSAEASEEEIMELKKGLVNPARETISPVDEQIEATSVPEESTDLIKSVSIFDEPLDTTLTSLPPKPASLQSKSEIEIPKFDDSRKLIARSKSKKKPKKSELLAEKKSLENKINSVKNLIEFVEKKHEAGDLDDDSFKKRMNQLKSDLKKTQNKIDEIDKMM
jgi:peptidoglycan hydrolase CwlO-like protein